MHQRILSHEEEEEEKEEGENPEVVDRIYARVLERNLTFPSDEVWKFRENILFAALIIFVLSLLSISFYWLAIK